LNYTMPYLKMKMQVYPGSGQPGFGYYGNNDNNMEEWLSMLGSRNPLPQFPGAAVGGGRKKTKKRRRKKRRKTIKKRKRKRKNKTNKKKH